MRPLAPFSKIEIGIKRGEISHPRPRVNNYKKTDKKKKHRIADFRFFRV
jgi:hypothetical protein